MLIRKRKNNIFLKIFLLIVVLIILGVILFLFLTKPLDHKTIKTSFIVSDKMGFDLNKNELTFGSLKPGNTASRAIAIENLFDKRVIITFNVEGNIKDYLIVSENDFILESREKRNVTFTALSYKNQSYGNYTGKINVIFKYV